MREYLDDDVYQYNSYTGINGNEPTLLSRRVEILRQEIPRWTDGHKNFQRFTGDQKVAGLIPIWGTETFF